MDKRTQRTHLAVCGAFGELLSRKKYSQITVQEIIEGAKVGRSTFYAHFSAKEDLLKEVCTDLFARKIFPYAPPPAEEGDGPGHLENLSWMLVHILKHLERDRRMIKNILESEGRNYFIACFREYMDEFTERYILGAGAPVPEGVSREFFKNHVSGSFAEAIQWWFGGNKTLSAREVAGQYIHVLAPLLPWFEK